MHFPSPSSTRPPRETGKLRLSTASMCSPRNGIASSQLPLYQSSSSSSLSAQNVSLPGFTSIETDQASAKLTTLANLLLPLLQRRGQRIRHPPAAAASTNPGRRQPAAVRARVARRRAADLCLASVADLAPVHLLERRDAPSSLDAVQDRRSRGVRCGYRRWRSRDAGYVARVAVGAGREGRRRGWHAETAWRWGGWRGRRCSCSACAWWWEGWSWRGCGRRVGLG